LPDQKPSDKGVVVPTGRLSRLAHFGSLATSIAGGALLDGARRLAQGQRPTVADLLLTPVNALKVTHQLSQLRGAAMKVGQLLSMDAGDVLPAEFTEILARLRADAQHMPQYQLQRELSLRWGKDWQQRFQSFSMTPVAAASIGQVHRARTRDGRDLAIKIQYPGVRQSIDSDVNNVASLMRLSGLLPESLNIDPILGEAKRQLHEEADYVRESAHLTRFAGLLAASPQFVVPALHSDLSAPTILAMSYVEGVPVDSLITAPQSERDRIMGLLIELVLRELFEFRLVQTDPNFANYHYDRSNKKLVLLDFGATREIPHVVAENYKRLMLAGLAVDASACRRAAIDLGLFDDRTPHKHQTTVMAMFETAMEPLRFDGAFDFGTTDVAARLRDASMTIAVYRDFWYVPPMDMLFVQRKIGGMFLLASRLKARVNVNALLEPYRNHLALSR
jgi:predicted unusual protein kinase regulating ubiquinone biosynthesis (AarF/ABC1/UbiB family)